MVLTLIWSFFFSCAVVVAMAKLVFWQDVNVFQTMVEMIFDTAKVSVTLAIGLVGIMAFWLGLLKIGEKAGVISFLSRLKLACEPACEPLKVRSRLLFFRPGPRGPMSRPKFSRIRVSPPSRSQG